VIVLVHRVRPNEQPFPAWGVGFVLAWLGLLAAAELLLVAWADHSRFLWIHLRYLDLLLVVPGCAAFLLTGCRPLSRTTQALVAVALAGVPLLLYGTFIEPNRLVLEEQEVELGARGHAPLTVALIADLQARNVTARERNAIALTLAAKPDLILISGDWQHGDSNAAYMRELPAFRALLGQLEAPLGVFFVKGNTDPRQHLEALTAGTGVQVLDDELTLLDHAGRRIALGGLDLSSYRKPEGRALVQALERTDADLRLLLAHKPDAVFAMRKDSPIDLLLAGHTHGGQVVVPFFGPPITLSAVPRRIARGGLHELDGRRVYVSRGIGLERGPAPPVRFLAPPELTLLTIR